MASSGEGPAIGIDLGTTYSCVAAWQHGKVETIVNGQGNRTTPSYVAFVDSDCLVGEAAFNQSARNPSNTIVDAKRLIGRRFSDPIVQSDIKAWPFKVIDGGDDNPKFVVSFNGDERRFSPEEISSMVLVNMREIAEKQLGTSVKNAVVTVPAYFNNSQRQATKDAAAAAGLNVLRIINEPTAAAIAFSLERRRQNGTEGRRTILVFDLGGGTFDVSLLSMDGGELKVIATAGDSHLGGIDFDRCLVEFCCDEFERRNRADIRGNPRALRRLTTACERAKRTLSYMVDTTIDIDYLFDGMDFQFNITRSKFEDLNTELFMKSMDLVEVCLKDSNVDKEAVDDVVLVGGSTRIPKVQELLQDMFQPSKIRRGVNPDEAVAVGAAIHAAVLGGDDTQSIDELLLTDVTPLSLGIHTAGGLMSVIIPRHTPIPAEMSRLFSTSFDNQTAIKFQVFEGERALTHQNNLLAKFKLDGITPAPAAVPRVLVRFEIDADGILTVSAEDQQTKGSADVIISKYGNATNSREHIRMMVEDGRRNKAKDEEVRKRLTPPPVGTATVAVGGNVGEGNLDRRDAAIVNVQQRHNKTRKRWFWMRLCT